jgi:hypothetical protein
MDVNMPLHKMYKRNEKEICEYEYGRHVNERASGGIKRKGGKERRQEGEGKRCSAFIFRLELGEAVRPWRKDEE